MADNLFIDISSIKNEGEYASRLKNMFPPVKSIEMNLVFSNENKKQNTFLDALNGEINNVNSKQHLSLEKMTAVEMGDDDDLVGAVMSVQKASMSFQLLLQIRNKMLEGYGELMNQQL